MKCVVANILVFITSLENQLAQILRFDTDNLIPICVRCHYNHHHNDDPIPHATIILKRGEEWYKQLEKKRFIYVKANIAWYNQNREKYEKI